MYSMCTHWLKLQSNRCASDTEAVSQKRAELLISTIDFCLSGHTLSRRLGTHDMHVHYVCTHMSIALYMYMYIPYSFSREAWISSMCWHEPWASQCPVGCSLAHVNHALSPLGEGWHHWKKWTSPAHPSRELPVVGPQYKSLAANEETSWCWKEERFKLHGPVIGIILACVSTLSARLLWMCKINAHTVENSDQCGSLTHNMHTGKRET